MSAYRDPSCVVDFIKKIKLPSSVTTAVCTSFSPVQTQNSNSVDTKK
jgi:hypothetical protein